MLSINAEKRANGWKHPSTSLRVTVRLSEVEVWFSLTKQHLIKNFIIKGNSFNT
jgi:hypothetical protein